MDFTYDLGSTGDELIVSKIRLEIGDSIADDGPRTEARNFTDTELLWFYSDEGGESLGRATARACEVLAREWARFADMRVGPQSEKLTDISIAWAKRASDLRSAHGGGVGSMTSSTLTFDFATHGSEG